VSDGFGFFIGPALARLGVPGLLVVTARTTFRGDRRAALRATLKGLAAPVLC
jgi:hypothetical protein